MKEISFLTLFTWFEKIFFWFKYRTDENSRNNSFNFITLNEDNFFFKLKKIFLKFIPSQSELFRFIPISVSEPMRIIPSQSKKCFVSRFMKKGEKSIRLNLINSETSIRLNPNESETKFELGLIRIDLD